MSHKVHPKIFRIKETKDWLSRGFYADNFKNLLEEDTIIRKYLDKKLRDLSVEKVEINRLPNQTSVLIHTSRPGLIIGRGGEGVERLTKELIKIISRKKGLDQEKRTILERRLKIEIKEVKNPWTSSMLIAQWIGQKIERRTPFRKTIKQAAEKAMMNKEVEGIKIVVSGRLDGVQIARTEGVEKGRLPRNTIRADIDYTLYEAVCTYGTIGIKVWLYKGEKFENN